ncbi:DcrB-related protein [Mixta intestinalis]|uniref:DUF1795 domain-containing protein n=1 Tax=Mixta intestinalis TaxID=1615494 RepID=A0A6P1Q723_9GAMM|nr:DcrB-related protein [Mixta intestinalis]QHM73869.1 hypothetical protein C7M51_04227 [Mixta intestinalis]
MSNTTSRCLFTEGSLAIPEGYIDQTVNVFRPMNGAKTAYSIARDRLPAGVTLADHISNQLAMLEKHMPGNQITERSSVWLGDRVIEGEQIVIEMQREGQHITQHQAIFLLDATLLVFTQTKNGPLAEEDNAQFTALLASFKPAA